MKLSPPLPPPRDARSLAAVVLLAIAVALGACSLTRPSPVKRTFLLEPAAPPAAAATRPAALRVGVVNVGAPFRGKAFVYRQDELRYEADFYHEFIVAPVAILSEATARALASANVFRRVIPPGATADDGDYVLDGFASELYGDARDPAKTAAVLAITYYVSRADAVTPAILWTREYRQRVPVAEAGAEAFARAWNVALAAILADLARDLATADLPKR